MQCAVCEHWCEIPEGRTGRCRMYVNHGGLIEERYAGSYLVEYPISIETMPLLHFYPRGKFLQVSTIGCNFSCSGCVSELCTLLPEEFAPSLKKRTPEELVEHAVSEDCCGISFCLNEPAVSYDTFSSLSKSARSMGLLVACSTNGYFTETALKGLLPYVDGVAVGVKGLRDESYRACGGQKAGPVYRNIRTLTSNGIHVEVAVMHERGNDEEVLASCRTIAAISPDIPLHVMRFIAFGSADLDHEPSILASERLCDRIRKELRYVYLFNSPGSPYLDTICPSCGNPVIHREMHGPMGAQVISHPPKGVCRCGYHIPYTGVISWEPFEEQGMMGGYRPTRAFEVIRSILTCLGIGDEMTCTRVWLDFMQRNYLNELQFKIQDTGTFFDIIMYLARITEREKEGMVLVTYLRDRLHEITSRAEGLSRPRVYYCMGTPLFALNEGRFETRLVEAAGGFSVNRNLKRIGKPGITITPDELEQMDPDILIISGLFSTPREESEAFCIERGLCEKAVAGRNIIGMPPSWDFGNPRWILGLMFLANTIHSEVFQYDLDAEAEAFYRKFYRISFQDTRPNRSFFRPGSGNYTGVNAPYENS